MCLVHTRIASHARIFALLFLAVVLLTPFSTAAANRSSEDSSSAASPRVPRAKRDSTRVFSSDQVVITGARNEVLQSSSPVRVEVVDRKQITNTGMVNLGNILQEQTGLALTTNVRSGVQMMGLNPDYTLILIDGQPMIGRVAGVIDLSRVSVGNIQRLEIVKGPMSSLYGSEALAGVINVITRRPDNGLGIRLYGQAITRGATEAQAELTYGGSTLDVSVFGNVKHSEPFERTQIWSEYSASPMRIDTLRTPFSGFTDYTLQTRLKYYVSPNASLTANIRYFNTRSEGSFNESFFGQVASNRGSVLQQDVSGTLSSEITLGKARLSLQQYISLYDETYNFDVYQGNAGRVDNLQRGISRTVAQYDLLWNLKNRFTFGGELQFDQAQGTRYPDRPFYRTFVAFAQWEGNPTVESSSDWLSYAVSARYDATNAFGSSFNPRLSVLVKPVPEVQIRSSVGTGFKAPDFRQLFVEFSNRLPGAGYDLIGAYRLGNILEPERSVAFDVGVHTEFSELLKWSPEVGTWSFEARAFHNALRNLIEFYFVQRVDNRDVYSYRNVAHAYTQGVETTLRGTVPLRCMHNKADYSERLSMSFGYQWLDAADVEVLNAIAAGTAGTVNPSTGAFERLTRQQYRGLWFRSPHLGTLRAQYDNDDAGWSANVRAQYIGVAGDEGLDRNGLVIGNPPRRVWDNESESIPAYWNINCTMSKTFTLRQTSTPSPSTSSPETASPLSIASPFAPKLLRVNIGVNNLLDVINLRSLPGMVGRQIFINATIEW
jgi:outer membrane receptor for ferrienterochelin and colicins